VVDLVSFNDISPLLLLFLLSTACANLKRVFILAFYQRLGSGISLILPQFSILTHPMSFLLKN